MNKSLFTNILTVLIIALGYFLQNNIILSTGLFALSGAITNTLAIHMLFEKVPFLYGSGVIEHRFKEFKTAIYSLIMNEFFTKDNLRAFFQDEIEDKKSSFDLEKVLVNTNFEPAFDSLKQVVVESSFGSMLGMFGGEAALDPLKEPFIIKLKSSIIEISKNESFVNALHESLGSSDISDDIYEKVSNIVNKRLDELTPKMVKQIIVKMIKEHLGWLVVWGGIFGGLIGLLSSLALGV